MLLDNAKVNDLTRQILGAAIEVHRQLGPGLLESVYLFCFQFELSARGLRFSTQRAVPIMYKGMLLDACYRVDLIVEDAVVVEIKAVSGLTSAHEAQTLTYLRLTECPAALLINFNAARLMDGVRRLLNTRAKDAQPSEATVQPRRHGVTETRGDDSDVQHEDTKPHEDARR